MRNILSCWLHYYNLIPEGRCSENDFQTFLPVNCSSKYLELNIVSPDAIFSLSLVIRCGCLDRRHSITTSAVINASSAADSLGLQNKHDEKLKKYEKKTRGTRKLQRERRNIKE